MEMQAMMDAYFQWLKEEYTFTDKGNGYYEIVAPFLDNFNDYIQFYVRLDNDEIQFTDDGFTINSLECMGLEFTKNRKKQMVQLLAQYGMRLSGREIVGTANANNFPQKKHMYIQAILSVNDMFLVSRSRVSSYFFDDIQEFLDENDIPYTPSVQFVGTSGYTHNYEFALPKMRGKPERLCKALNNPSKEKIESILFAWQDTQPVRPSESKLIIFMNDQKKISKDIYTALNNYNVSPIDWSKRFQVDVMNILRAG